MVKRKAGNVNKEFEGWIKKRTKQFLKEQEEEQKNETYCL